MRIILVRFGLGLLLNAVWENAHASLYMHYRGGTITEIVLLRAALVDAFFIFVLIGAARFLPARYRTVGIFIGGIIVAVLLELWALQTGRWAYAPAMPVVPFLGTGLSPTVQLGLTAIAVAVVSGWRERKRNGA